MFTISVGFPMPMRLRLGIRRLGIYPNWIECRSVLSHYIRDIKIEELFPPPRLDKKMDAVIIACCSRIVQENECSGDFSR